MAKRDYSLLGPDARRAVETGLAAAEWYHTEVPRKDMKALMQRSDQPAIRDTVILFGSMAVFAVVGIFLWPSLWSVPFWLAYGVLYGSAMDSRWHECSHGTAFKTPWMNDWLYNIASLHDRAQPGDLALEPCPAPHRHLYRRPRPRDCGDAPAGAGQADRQFLRDLRRLERLEPDAAERRRTDRPRGGDLHSRKRNSPR